MGKGSTFRKILAGCLATSLVLAPPADAQSPWGTAAMQAWKQSITPSGNMGVPRYATAALPTCDANNIGALAYDTTLSGLYVCIPNTWTAAGGVTLAGANTWTGQQTFNVASGAAAVFSDTITVPNGSVGSPSIAWSADGIVSGTGFYLVNNGQIGFTSQGTLFSSWGSTGTPTRELVGTAAKNLTAGAATPFVRIGVPSGAMTTGVIEYGIEASDATDHQARGGSLYFSVVNKAGTETCTLYRATGGTTVDNTTDGVAVSAGTLTNTFTCDTTPANGVDIAANAASSLTETVLRITYTVRKNLGAGVITAQ